MDIRMPDKLDMMMALAAKDCGNDDVELLDTLDISEVSLDKHFRRKKARIVEKHKRYPTMLALKKGMLRVAIVLMVIMSLGFTTIMAISPMRKAIFEVIIEWYEDYLTIRYEQAAKDVNDASGEEGNDTKDNDENSPLSDPVIIPPTVIEEVRKPTVLPQNVVEDIVIQNKSFVCIDYYEDGELAYTFNQMLLKDRDMYLDNEGAIVETVDINGNSGTVIQHTEFSGISVVWSDGEYNYQMITQSTSLDELIHLCRSVQ